MAVKKSYPLRINPDVLAAMQQWAEDELRSVNAQIEYVLRDALVRAGRAKEKPRSDVKELSPGGPGENNQRDNDGDNTAS